MKISDYTEEEKLAVFNHFFSDTPNVQFEDLTELQLKNIMGSYNGSRIVINMRLRDLRHAFVKAFKDAWGKRK